VRIGRVAMDNPAQCPAYYRDPSAEFAAADTGCHVQTHCSESDWEHRYVLERFQITDTAAHGAGIAHCPLSNVYFSDAVLPLRRVLERGVHVGLGSDIAGGGSPSILDNARHAVAASRSS
jgi:guanine deaminase